MYALEFAANNAFVNEQNVSLKKFTFWLSKFIGNRFQDQTYIAFHRNLMAILLAIYCTYNL